MPPNTLTPADREFINWVIKFFNAQWVEILGVRYIVKKKEREDDK